jgi:hypothetical protein
MLSRNLMVLLGRALPAGVARNGLVVHGAGHIYILRRSSELETSKKKQGKEKRFHVVVLIDD